MTLPISTKKESLIQQMYAIKDELNSMYGCRFAISSIDAKAKPRLNLEALKIWVNDNYPTSATASRKMSDWIVRMSIMMVLVDRKKRYQGLTLSDIGSIFNRSHSSVLYSSSEAREILMCEFGLGDMESKSSIHKMAQEFTDLLDTNVFHI